VRARGRDLAEAIARARDLLADERDQEALGLLEKSVEEFPESPEIRVLLVRVYRRLRPDEVGPQLKKAVELGRDDPAIQVRAGHLLLHEDEVEAARACAARAEELVVGDWNFAADLDGLVGRVAAREGRDALAEEKLRSAIGQEPEYPSHWLHLARFLWARDRDGEALALIDESLDQVLSRDNLELLRADIASGRPWSPDR
jgi:tetratricopeptide (TPR) repeat protein